MASWRNRGIESRNHMNTAQEAEDPMNQSMPIKESWSTFMNSLHDDQLDQQRRSSRQKGAKREAALGASNNNLHIIKQFNDLLVKKEQKARREGNGEPAETRRWR